MDIEYCRHDIYTSFFVLAKVHFFLFMPKDCVLHHASTCCEEVLRRKHLSILNIYKREYLLPLPPKNDQHQKNFYFTYIIYII